MWKKDMTFAEIQADRELFLHQYEVAELFPKCGVSWETLMEIGDDYETKCYGAGRAKNTRAIISKSSNAILPKLRVSKMYTLTVSASKKLEAFWQKLSERELNVKQHIHPKIIFRK